MLPYHDNRDGSLVFNYTSRFTVDIKGIEDVERKIGVNYSKGKNSDRKRHTLRTLLLNLFRAFLHEGHLSTQGASQECWVFVSLNRWHYTSQRHYFHLGQSHEAMTEIRDRLRKQGALNVWTGTKGRKMSKFRAIGWLSEYLKTLNLTSEGLSDDLEKRVVLKDAEKQWIHYEENELTLKSKAVIQELNELNQLSQVAIGFPAPLEHRADNTDFTEHTVSVGANTLDQTSILPGPFCLPFLPFQLPNPDDESPLVPQTIPAPMTSLYRVFNNSSWEQGGRFYGSIIQNMKSSVRRLILIDDSPTVELDYSAMHPRMLLARTRIDPGAKDLYAGVRIPGMEAARARHTCKIAIQILLNSLSRTSALRAINESISLPVDVKAETVLVEVERRFAAIRKFFCTGIGLQLQRQDSDITAAILERFIAEGRPIHPIHDSFVVVESDADLLRAAMSEAFLHHVGTQPVIKETGRSNGSLPAARIKENSHED